MHTQTKRVSLAVLLADRYATDDVAAFIGSSLIRVSDYYRLNALVAGSMVKSNSRQLRKDDIGSESLQIAWHVR